MKSESLCRFFGRSLSANLARRVVNLGHLPKRPRQGRGGAPSRYPLLRAKIERRDQTLILFPLPEKGGRNSCPAGPLPGITGGVAPGQRLEIAGGGEACLGLRGDGGDPDLSPGTVRSGEALDHCHGLEIRRNVAGVRVHPKTVNVVVYLRPLPRLPGNAERSMLPDHRRHPRIAEGGVVLRHQCLLRPGIAGKGTALGRGPETGEGGGVPHLRHHDDAITRSECHGHQLHLVVGTNQTHPVLLPKSMLL